LLTRLQPGDTLVVWKLDRLSCSLKNLVELVVRFQEQDIQFVSLQDHLDTSTAQGRLMFNLFASLAEFERDLIRERTHAACKEAQSKAEAAKTLYLQKDKSVDEIAQLLSLGRSIVYRYLGLLGVTTTPAES
jgi:DNA invertase Pin-like site-specific DNA recombinase